MGIRIVIDGIPVAKGRGKIGRLPNGIPTVFTPSHTRKYENLIKMKASEAMEGKIPYDEPLTACVAVYLPIPMSFSNRKKLLAREEKLCPAKRPDIDNYIKSAFDGLNSIVFRDDALIVDVQAKKRYSDKPRLEIEIRAVSEA